MNIKKIASAASTLLAASLLLSGCSAVSNGDNDAAEVSKPTEIKSIGLMVQDMSNPFFTAMDKEAKAQAKKIGNAQCPGRPARFGHPGQPDLLVHSAEGRSDHRLRRR